MRRLWKVIIITTALTSTLFSENCMPITEIDGFTSASRRFKISGGEACETYAKVTWLDYWNNGSIHELQYGTTPQYGEKINLKPFSTGKYIDLTIPNLQRETKYYAQFVRIWHNIKKYHKFEFTTQEKSNCDPIPEIDGMTSASRRFTIINGESCETSAKIRWKDYWNNGSIHELQYGTTAQYGQKINLKPITSNKEYLTVIPQLTPNTKYYGQFVRIWNNIKKYHKFEFITKAAVAIDKSHSVVNVRQSVSVRNGELYLTGTYPAAAKVSLINPRGQKVFTAEVSNKKRIILPKMSRGIYLIHIHHIGTLITTKKMTL